jgi:hypothetical protein
VGPVVGATTGQQNPGSLELFRDISFFVVVAGKANIYTYSV